MKNIWRKGAVAVVAASFLLSACSSDKDDSAADKDKTSDSIPAPTFEAGSTITLRFQEFVNHAGRFRVAFDPDGADVADFNANILEDVQDPANASGMVWEIPVTLPNMTCDNCTIQLVQAMEVDQNTPIADPAPISSYYACADIPVSYTHLTLPTKRIV